MIEIKEVLFSGDYIDEDGDVMPAANRDSDEIFNTTEIKTVELPENHPTVLAELRNLAVQSALKTIENQTGALTGYIDDLELLIRSERDDLLKQGRTPERIANMLTKKYRKDFLRITLIKGLPGDAFDRLYNAAGASAKEDLDQSQDIVAGDPYWRKVYEKNKANGQEDARSRAIPKD